MSLAGDLADARRVLAKLRADQRALGLSEDDADPRKASRAYRARVAVEAWEAAREP